MAGNFYKATTLTLGKDLYMKSIDRTHAETKINGKRLSLAELFRRSIVFYLRYSDIRTGDLKDYFRN